MATKSKSTKATKSAKVADKKTNSCLCGCGTKVKGTFAQGHDAKLRGMLLRGEVKSPNAEQKAFAKAHKFVIGANKKVAKAA